MRSQTVTGIWDIQSLLKEQDLTLTKQYKYTMEKKLSSPEWTFVGCSDTVEIREDPKLYRKRDLKQKAKWGSKLETRENCGKQHKPRQNWEFGRYSRTAMDLSSLQELAHASRLCTAWAKRKITAPLAQRNSPQEQRTMLLKVINGLSTWKQYDAEFFFCIFNFKLDTSVGHWCCQKESQVSPKATATNVDAVTTLLHSALCLTRFVSVEAPSSP